MMMLTAASHQVPELHLISSLSGILGSPDNLVLGFGVHLFIGAIVWGCLFAWLVSRIPARTYLMKGLMFGICAWLMMMVIFMPLTGAGVFASNVGTMTIPLVTLAYHLVFGAVLGYIYGSNLPSAKSAINDRATRNA